MKRRHLIGSAAMGTAGAVAAYSATKAQAQPTASTPAQPAITWRMATSWPRSLDIVYGSLEALCRRVRDVSGGRFAITPYPAGELAPALQVLEAVQSGKVECGHTVSYYSTQKQEALVFAATLPFGLTVHQQNAWLNYGGGLEILQKLFNDFGVVFFPAGSPGVQMGGWFRKEINSIPDFQGLKFRIAGFGGQVMNRLGANTKALGGDRIYQALETGEIDAAEWQNPYDDEKLGLHKIAKFYYYPGWWEPGLTYSLVIDQKQWQQLPREYQRILQSAVAETHSLILSRYNAANGEALERLIAGGTQLRAYSPEIMQAAHRAAFDLYEEKARQDPTFKEIYVPWKQFRDQIYRWNQINELSFENFTLNLA